MKHIFVIKDKNKIEEILNRAEYGTLALCDNNSKPYSVPVNFVTLDGAIYFHGSHQGRKMNAIKNNQQVSFSVVEDYSLIQSYFSSDSGLACPATQFFKSIVIDGCAVIIHEQIIKAKIMELLMKKHQPEGEYLELSDASYEKALKVTAIVKIEIEELQCKFKFGQHLNKERFDRIIQYLEKRGEQKDLETISIMKEMKI